MNLNEYQQLAKRTAGPNSEQLEYLIPGLCGEAGEVASVAAKVARDDGHVWSDAKRQKMMLEIGDCLWFVSELSRHFGWTLEQVAQANIDKLADRQKRGVIAGSGDNR